MNITFYPIFKTSQELNQHVLRASWYLYPLEKYISNVFFIKEKNFDYKPTSIKVLGDKTLDIFEKFNQVLIKNEDELELSFVLKTSDYVFVHDERTRSELIRYKKHENLNFEIVRVDFNNVQYADSFLLRFAEKIENLHDKYFKISKDRVQKLLEPLRRENAYLFGTGPNFEYTKNYDFSDGVVIACNSMVINKELIEQLRPDLFVIADPIFHAGPSSYAESFRASFLEILGEQKCPVVVPMRDFHIYSTYFPKEIVDRLLPIPFKNPGPEDNAPLLDIFEDKAVRTTSNILTLFQLPLASTLSRNIYISGCDGRPLSQNNYFWSHNKSVQINDKMSEIREAHPSFFEISYDDYYSKHLQTLELWISSAEAIGKKVINLTPSYIPALNVRSEPLLLPKVKDFNESYDVSIIIPLYNAECYIEQAVSSIINDCKNKLSVEVLIIDDMSEDASLEIANKLAASNPSIKVLQNFSRKGVSGARNTGMNVAKGSVIGFLDADDFVLPGSIIARYKKCIANRSIVHSVLVFVDDKGASLGVEVSTRRDISYLDCASGNPCSFNTLMFPRELKQFFHFEEGLSNGEDWLAIARALRTGLNSIYVPEGKAAYRIHGESTVIKDFVTHEKSLNRVIEELHTTSNDENAAQDYKGSCFKVTQEKVKCYRRLNLLIMELLNSEESTFQHVKHDKILLALIAKEKDLERRLRVPFIRSFNMHVDLADQLPLHAKINIALNLKKLEKIIGQSELSASIQRFFKIHDGILEAENELTTGNLFLKEGNYKAALDIYEKLYKRKEFYSFLNFNIAYCKSKIMGQSLVSFEEN